MGLIHTTGPKLPRLAAKYSPLVPALRELVLRPDTPLDADVKTMIAGQLDSAQGRFAAIWHGHAADSDAGQTSAPQLVVAAIRALPSPEAPARQRRLPGDASVTDRHRASPAS